MSKTLQEIIAADISDVLLTDFIVDAAFSHAGGAASTVKGIFDNEYAVVKFAGDMAVESSSPAFTCKTSDVTSAVHGDTLTINSVVYKIIEKQPDGTGMTVLILSRD